MMKKFLFLVIISSLFLASCNSVRSSAGVNRKVIDEYVVVENPPLVIPPNFFLLPPEQLESKNIDDADTDLAKEILFGLDNEDSNSEKNSSLMAKILDEAEAEEIDSSIRDTINEEFAGEKSSIIDEDVFKNEDELNKAIEETQKNKKTQKIEKKKKRFFFF